METESGSAVHRSERVPRNVIFSVAKRSPPQDFAPLRSFRRFQEPQAPTLPRFSWTAASAFWLRLLFPRLLSTVLYKVRGKTSDQKRARSSTMSRGHSSRAPATPPRRPKRQRTNRSDAADSGAEGDEPPPPGTGPPSVEAIDSKRVSFRMRISLPQVEARQYKVYCTKDGLTAQELVNALANGPLFSLAGLRSGLYYALSPPPGKFDVEIVEPAASVQLAVETVVPLGPRCLFGSIFRTLGMRVLA